MSGFDDAYRAMREEAAAARNKRVLLVEGRGDVDFLTYMLDKQPLRSAGFYSRFAIGAAGGKDNVLRMLEREPEWLGLVDRDAWSARTRDAYEGKLRNLYFLPRYCIENYLIENTDPDKVMFELDVYWATKGGVNPSAYIQKYAGRFPLLHIKDDDIIGASQTVDFEAIFNAAYKCGLEAYYVEIEANSIPIMECAEKSAQYLSSAKFVK